MVEIRPNSRRHRCNALDAGSSLVDQRDRGLCDRARVDGRLQIAVQICVGVQFWGVWRQVEQLDGLGVLGNSLTDALGAMHAEIFDDEEDFAAGILDKVLQKHDEGSCA